MAQLSISDIRRELLRAAGDYGASGAQAGAQASALTGTLFHQALAGLMGPNGWQAALEPDELADSCRLARHAYEKLLGPRLTEMQAALRESGTEAMNLWDALRAACDWLCRVLTAAEQRGIIRYDQRQRAWQGAEQLCQPELELRWDVKEPHWTDGVRVFGVADALWKNPENGRWCVLEYKLGKPRPEADLAQACLYHCALAASGLSNGDGALAVITFGPELKERFYASADLCEAQAALLAWIGRLANVLPEAPPHPACHVSPASEQHLALGKKLVQVLREYGVPVEWKGDLTAGPSFLRYFILPGRQTKLKQVKDRAEDLGMQLNLTRHPMIHHTDGRLVIDVARPDPQIVTFGSILDQLPRPDGRGCSRTPLGVDLNGRLQFVDLASSSNPHLLVAGTSGSGKTAWLLSAIAGLTLSNTPETLRLVLIDPKRTAFAELKGSPYLDHLVYPPEHSAMDALDPLIEEMERRYQLFEQNRVGDLPEYQAKTGKVLPRLVCVCDEYADLLIDRAATRSVAGAISRLGAKARAAGIHLMIATQYPDRKTVDGALKMNLGGRVCLRVSNHQQSNMIINQSGAERLLGNGDLFFLSIGDPVRLQAPYLSPEERARVFS